MQELRIRKIEAVLTGDIIENGVVAGEWKSEIVVLYPVSDLWPRNLAIYAEKQHFEKQAEVPKHFGPVVQDMSGTLASAD